MFRAACLTCSVLVLMSLLATPVVPAQETVVIRRAVAPGDSDPFELMADVGFESTAAEDQNAWTRGTHTEITPTRPRNGTRCIRVWSDGPGGNDAGVRQVKNLNRDSVRPLVLRGSSRAEYHYDSVGMWYAVILQLTYMDAHEPSTVVLSFPPGPSEWRTRSTVFMPLAPVRTATVAATWQRSWGEAWFDDVSLAEIEVDWEVVNFDGQAVLTAAPLPAPETLVAGHRVESKDGRFALTCSEQAGYVTRLEMDGTNYADPGAVRTSGFSIRDWTGPEVHKIALPVRAQPTHLRQEGALPGLGVRFSGTVTPRRDRLEVSVEVENRRTDDRALTVYFTLPVDAKGWTWWDGLRTARQIGNDGDYRHCQYVGAGGTGWVSTLPAAAIGSPAGGLAAWASPDRPASARLGYNDETKEFYVACDVALTSKGGKPPNQSAFTFWIGTVPGADGLRETLARVHADAPGIFESRKVQEGALTWVTPPSTIANGKDFGFAWDLIPFWRNDVDFAADDKAGIATLLGIDLLFGQIRRPSAPGSYGDIKAGLETALKLEDSGALPEREREALREAKTAAQMIQACGLWKEGGEFAARYDGGPQMLQFLCNPDPDLRGPGGISKSTAAWQAKELATLYAPNKRGQVDGHWINAVEQYGACLDHRPAALQATDGPLVFRTETLKPGLWLATAQGEFHQWLGGELKKRKKLLVAHGGSDWCWSTPAPFDGFCWELQLDDNADPMNAAADEAMLYRLALAGERPIVTCLVANYNMMKGERLRRILRWCAFYGSYPAHLRHRGGGRRDELVWETPDWADTLRDETRAAIEIVRELRAAGWRPATHATVEPADVRIERWGDHKDGSLAYSVFNPTAESRQVVVHVDAAAEGIAAGSVKVKERSGASVSVPVEGKSLNIPLTLEPGDLKVVQIRR